MIDSGVHVILTVRILHDNYELVILSPKILSNTFYSSTTTK